MARVTLEEPGCRGCSLCVETCPVQVFALADGAEVPTVAAQESCIGCLSCAYDCPSQCIEVAEILSLRPFHRIEQHARLVRRFLQRQTAAEALTEADVEEAWHDVAARLGALSATVTETLGSGYRAVARRAGTMAAAHLPEMYEEAGLDGVLTGMQRQLGSAFAFDFTLDDGRAALRLDPCGLCRVVEERGEALGEAVLCQLFHEYWAGLLSAFLGARYRCQVAVSGSTCNMDLFPVD
jgi:ferredoxin